MKGWKAKCLTTPISPYSWKHSSDTSPHFHAKEQPPCCRWTWATKRSGWQRSEEEVRVWAVGRSLIKEQPARFQGALYINMERASDNVPMKFVGEDVVTLWCYVFAKKAIALALNCEQFILWSWIDFFACLCVFHGVPICTATSSLIPTI